MNIKDLFIQKNSSNNCNTITEIKNLRSNLIKMKEDMEKEYVIFYNDGFVGKTSKNAIIEKENGLSNPFFWIENRFTEACNYYERRNEFDNLNMDLHVGIIYNKSDVNEDNTLKEGSQPLNGKVHFSTATINSYKDGVKSNDESRVFGEMFDRRDSYIDYNYLVKKSVKEGLDFNGPETFNELKEKINNKELFDINLSLDLQKDKTMTLKK